MKKFALLAAASIAMTGCWTGAEVKEMADETKAAAVEAVEQAKVVTAEKVEEAKVVAAEVKETVVTKAEAAKAELDALVENTADRTACITSSMSKGYYSGTPVFVKPGVYKFNEFTPAGEQRVVEATCTVVAGEVTFSIPVAPVVEEPVVVEAVEDAPAVPVVAPAGTVIESVEASVPDVEPVAVRDEQKLCGQVALQKGWYPGDATDFPVVAEGTYLIEQYTTDEGATVSATCTVDADMAVTITISKS